MWKIYTIIFLALVSQAFSQDIVGCGGFVQSDVPIAFEKVEVKLYTKQGAYKFKTECAPNNGYFLVAVYDKGDYVLKIDPPVGWGFEPKEISLNIDGKTDRCSKGEDLNFKFIGFRVSGKIGTVGKESGPSGVTINLLDKDSKILSSNVTDEIGGFQYDNVMPGNYIAQASHPTWTLKQDKVHFTVENDNVETQTDIVIAGYDVKGHVLSSGDPIQGVSFILFANGQIDKDAVSGCEKVPEDLLSKLKENGNEKPLCFVLSDKDGLFSFPTVPTGNYILVPYYTTQNIVFDIVPSKLSFAVNFRSVMFKTPFQVYGFSVTGKVIDSKGNGIPDVKVTATSQKGEKRSAVSNVDGHYLLENVTSNHYKFLLEKPHYHFIEESIHITPNTPNVKDIMSTRYSVCGKILAYQLPPGVLKVHQHKVLLTLFAEKVTSSNIKSTNPDMDGNFCFSTEPGKYKLEVHTTENERKLGFLLKPSHLTVDLVNEPILGLQFEQFRSVVTGKINCIEECKDLSVYMTPSNSPNDKQYGKVEGSGPSVTFVFQNVLPGKYKVFPVRKNWCWSPLNKEIAVEESNIGDIELTHSGYHLKCKISHNITLNFTLEGRNEVVGSFELKQGSNQFCVKAAGTYSLTPKSCYQFEKLTYTYKTSDPKSLTLSVAFYKVIIQIISSKKVSDLQVKVRTSTSEDILTPTYVESKDQNYGFLYEIVHWAKLAQQLIVTPISKEVLFLPKSSSVTVRENCPGGQVQFNGKEGIFVEGEIVPPFSNVFVIIKTESNEYEEGKVMEVMTDENGKYRVGPLHGGTVYSVDAYKEGYFITPFDKKKGSFVAQKLGHITVKVVDENNEPMSSVLLSLSGGQYRNNNLTQMNGAFTFSNLGPGQYFLRPMKKEYNFEPSSKMIDVSEGEDVIFHIKGTRVAFSVSGFVSTLSGIPEKSIAIEAVGMHKCSEYQESTITDNNGNYRLRGLMPGCAYNIRMMRSKENEQVERLAPANHVFQIQKEDISNVNFILFMKPTKFHLSVQVETEYDYLPNLKVVLYAEDNPDSPIHTLTMGAIKYIKFPPLPPKTYVVKLHSNLSPSTHETKSTSATIEASQDLSKKHVKLKFDVKKRRVDMEPTQSVIALPFAVALVFLAYNYDAVLVFLLRAKAFMQSLNQQEEDENESNQENEGLSLNKKKKKL